MTDILFVLNLFIRINTNFLEVVVLGWENDLQKTFYQLNKMIKNYNLTYSAGKIKPIVFQCATLSSHWLFCKIEQLNWSMLLTI
jgi:hypothetical protein